MGAGQPENMIREIGIKFSNCWFSDLVRGFSVLIESMSSHNDRAEPLPIMATDFEPEKPEKNP